MLRENKKYNRISENKPDYGELECQIWVLSGVQWRSPRGFCVEQRSHAVTEGTD